MVDIVIENADAILTIDPNGTILKESSIAIDNGRIVGLGAAEDISKQFMAEQTIDGRWKVAIPGLIDTHTHLSQAFQRGLMDEMPLMPWLRKLWVIESKMDKERYKTGVLLACLEKVKTGTTCTVDMTSDADLVAEEAPKSGIRTVIAGVMSDYPELPGTPVGSKEEEIKQAEKWYRKYEGALNGRIHFIFSPVGFPASSPELLKEAAVRARELGARIHTHAAEGPVTRKLCERRYGKGEIELLEDLDFLGPDVHLAHCIQIDDTEVKTIAKYGAAVAHCPSSNLKLGSGVSPIAQLIWEGGTVSLGVDGAAANNSQDMFLEMKIASLIQKGVSRNATVLPACQVLKMSTINGAKAIGLENEIGSIEIGKKADIVLVDCRAPHLLPKERIVSHLVYSAKGSDVSTVIIDGKVIVKDRRFLPFDEQSFIGKAQEELSAFIGKQITNLKT